MSLVSLNHSTRNHYVYKTSERVLGLSNAQAFSHSDHVFPSCPCLRRPCDFDHPRCRGSTAGGSIMFLLATLSHFDTMVAGLRLYGHELHRSPVPLRGRSPGSGRSARHGPASSIAYPLQPPGRPLPWRLPRKMDLPERLLRVPPV